MKAAQISEYGDPSVVKVNDIDVPTPKPGQVLVEVYASSLNPFDTTLRKGMMKEMIPLQFPATLGGDFAGIITQVTDGVTDMPVGDKVYGQAAVVAGNSGAWAESATTSASQVAKMPANLDFQQAASLPLVGASALQALNQHLHLTSGQKLFINGGAGGIGSIAIQVAKHIGAYVATTATGDDINFVKNLGADEVIDYKSQDFSTILKDYDAVFDLVVGTDFKKLLTILKPGGIAVSMINQPDQELAHERGVTAIMQSTKVTTDILNNLTQLVESGVIKPQVDKVFPLDQIQQALQTRENGSVKGKVLIAIR